MIGAAGGVGCTVALGLAALRRRVIEPVGLVTECPPISNTPLAALQDIEIGGHEIRSASLEDGVEQLHQRSGLFRRDVIRACAPQLRRWNRHIRPGSALGIAPNVRAMANRSGVLHDGTPWMTVKHLARDISDFRTANKLARVVVIHLGSTEPPARSRAIYRTWNALRKALENRGPCPVPASSLYALAALEARAAYVNFTPSTGIQLPALRERAESLNLPYAGRDGKTGETLVKSALAPMFAIRKLRVLSWIGQNLLGNRDGDVLRDPKARSSKIASKTALLSSLVGDVPTARVDIDFVPSLDDWKLAWDFIHFEGFLDTRMTMQFCWHGSDSALAAPLVIDLARLAALDVERGASGPMTHLACFFKDPMDAPTHDLSAQWRLLVEHVTSPPPPKRSMGAVSDHARNSR